MYALNLIGLILGYLGSISLSVGIIKSKQEVVDEERPFLGPNPFKMRSTLRSRLLGFAGVAMLVAGFATSTVATAFNTVFHINHLPLALGVIFILVGSAYLVIALALDTKKRAHLNAKSRYYMEEFTNEVRKLKDDLKNHPLESMTERTFSKLKKQTLQQFSHYGADLTSEARKQTGKLMSALDKAKNTRDIVRALDDFLALQEND